MAGKGDACRVVSVILASGGLGRVPDAGLTSCIDDMAGASTDRLPTPPDGGAWSVFPILATWRSGTAESGQLQRSPERRKAVN